jgi:hypothetical protein
VYSSFTCIAHIYSAELLLVFSEYYYCTFGIFRLPSGIRNLHTHFQIRQKIIQWKVSRYTRTRLTGIILCPLSALSRPAGAYRNDWIIWVRTSRECHYVLQRAEIDRKENPPFSSIIICRFPPVSIWHPLDRFASIEYNIMCIK